MAQHLRPVDDQSMNDQPTQQTDSIDQNRIKLHSGFGMLNTFIANNLGEVNIRLGTVWYKVRGFMLSEDGKWVEASIEGTGTLEPVCVRFIPGSLTISTQPGLFTNNFVL